MKVCCAHRIVNTAIETARAADPIAHDLPKEQFLFTADDVFGWLQEQGRSIAEITDIVNTLKPTLNHQCCTCGETDPTICGQTFKCIIGEMYDKPTEH